MLNSDYYPVPANDVNAFKEKKKSMQDFFYKMLQTNRGKKHVRDHESRYNYQSAHNKLSVFFTKSTNARVSASITLSFIISAKIKSWKGTAEVFMLHW